MDKDVKIGLAIGLLLLVALFVWFAVRSGDEEEPTGEPVATGDKDPGDGPAARTTSTPTTPKGDPAAAYHAMRNSGDEDDETEVEIKGIDPGPGVPEEVTIIPPPLETDVTPEGTDFTPPGMTTDTTPRVADTTPTIDLGPSTSVPPTRPARHVVKPGETLSAIAQQVYGAEKHWPLIAKANNITDPASQVHADMVLKIPPLPVETAPAAPLPGLGEKVHVVVANDSLSGISGKHYGTVKHWRLIAKANNLEEDAVLQVGKRLIIPDLPTTVPVPTTPLPGLGEKTHVVKQGDTLQGISEHYYGTIRYYKLIQEANKLADPDALKAGQTLIIPQKPAAGTPSAPESAEPRLGPGEKRYVVKEDETLSEIAESQLGSKRHYPEIMKRNSITDARLVRAGQVIIIPSLSALHRASSVTRED